MDSVLLLASGDDGGGQVTLIKTLLACVLVVLACYQVLLMTVTYGLVRVRFLGPSPAASAHRAIGDAAVLVALTVSYLCVTNYDVGDAWEAGGGSRMHVFAGISLLSVLAVKIVAVRAGGRLGRLLPYLGVTVLGLFCLLWWTMAITYFKD